MDHRRPPFARLFPVLSLLVAAGNALPASRPQEPASPASALPIEGETWYSMRDGEQRYGAVHVVVQRRGDGGTEVRSTSTVRIELFGKPQEHGTETKVVIDSELRLVEFETTHRTASGSHALRGAATAAGLVVRSEQAGRTNETVMPAAEIADLVVDAALEAWFHRSAWRDGEPRRRVRLLSTESGVVVDAAVHRTRHGDGGSTWEVHPDGGVAPMVLRLDAAGSIVEQFVRVPPLHMVRCSRTEAAEFTHRRIPDRELLVFQPPQPLPPASRLARVTVELTWQGIDPSEFELTDSRQRVLSLVADGAKHTARVELTRAGELACRYSLADGLDAAPPALRATLAAALSDDDLVQPSDARIVAKAREIVGDETSALAASRKLCTWVHGYIEPAMIAETLSGPEVLERRTGKCTECSTLFASLARAAGIPTRLALGQRRFAAETGDSWGGHMWNEVFVGEWVPVDASVDEFGGSPSLLKFVHSDSVSGTQPLRWKLTESLALAIVDHEPMARPTTGAELVTGLVGRTYTNAEHSFRFELPGDQWRATPTERGGVTTLRVQPPSGAGASAQIHLVVFPADGKMQPRPLLEARLQSHRAAMPDLKVGGDEAVEVAGCRGHRLRFEGMLSGDVPKQRRVTEVMWMHDGQGFLLNLIAEPSAHDAHLANFDAMLASFAFPGP
jgi:transglutaminase-like putative cysteine protease